MARENKDFLVNCFFKNNLKYGQDIPITSKDQFKPEYLWKRDKFGKGINLIN